METNKISVIIILYFSRHLISDIIFNVQQQIKDLGEIILVNNSRENIDEFRTDSIIPIYPERNLGYGSAINLGVIQSKFEYLLILNPDLRIKKFDLSVSDVRKQVIMSGHNPTMPGYYSKFPSLFATFIEYSIMELTYVKALDKVIQFKRIKEDADEVSVDFVSGALMFTNKSTFNKIGGFDSSFFLFYEETDFCKRASHLKIPVIATSKIVYESKEGKSSSINVNNIKIKSGINSCKKYHYKYDGTFVTICIFTLLKLQYALIILFISPFSLISQKLKLKRSEFILRMRLF